MITKCMIKKVHYGVLTVNMIPHNNIGLSLTNWSTRKYISINLSTGASRIWICSWDNLEDDHNSKYEKIVLEEPYVSLNTGRILANHSSPKFIRSVLNKTHVPDFPNSSPFAQNINHKLSLLIPANFWVGILNDDLEIKSTIPQISWRLKWWLMLQNILIKHH